MCQTKEASALVLRLLSVTGNEQYLRVYLLLLASLIGTAPHTAQRLGQLYLAQQTQHMRRRNLASHTDRHQLPHKRCRVHKLQTH
jgi:hypothetical protein